MDLTYADTLAKARGFMDWEADYDANAKAAALIRASDQIVMAYNLRTVLTQPEQDRLDLATLLIARDILATGSVPALRSAQTVKKSDKELNGLKLITEYYEAPGDPYPQITTLLAPLLNQSSRGDFFSGVQAL